MRVLYIDIDSLRPSHLGCYGYHRATSPAIDAIARQGVVFERAYTSDAPCMPSRTALYSGRFGIQTGLVGHGGTAGQPKVQGPGRGFRDSFYEQGLAHQLQLLGLRTAMISPFGQRHAAWHIFAGFDEIHDTGRLGFESADQVQPIVREWLKAHGGSDGWFLHVNYWDPHTPYRTPASYGEPFASDPLPEWLEDRVIEGHARLPGPHSALDVGMYDDDEDPKYPRYPGKVTDRPSLRRMIDGYDTGTRYADDRVGEIIAELKALGVFDETIIIISSDHGENLGELGIYGEHGTADEATCHIPLIVKFPGGIEGGRVKGLVYALDLSPTLVELLNGNVPSAWDGQSFATALRGDDFSGREELVISQCCHVCQRSVRWDRWLYIRTYHCGFHLFPDEMLFDLTSDPHELNDRAELMSEICREGAWRLLRWHDRQMATVVRRSSDAIDPLWTVIQEGGPYHARISRMHPGRPGIEGFGNYLERLVATGRSEAAAQLKAKYGHLLA